MGENRFISDAVFYSHQSPNDLAALLKSIIRPIEIPGDISRFISVPNDTGLEAVKTMLGTKTSITVSGVVADVTVSWGGDTSPTYNQSTAGTYVLDGTISDLPANIKNTGTHKIKVSIVVDEPEEE